MFKLVLLCNIIIRSDVNLTDWHKVYCGVLKKYKMLLKSFFTMLSKFMICLPDYGLNNIIGKQDEVF